MGEIGRNKGDKCIGRDRDRERGIAQKLPTYLDIHKYRCRDKHTMGYVNEGRH